MEYRSRVLERREYPWNPMWRNACGITIGSVAGPAGGGPPYFGYIGMRGPKGYGFSAVLVINKVGFLHSSLELGVFFRSYFFVIIDETIIKSPSWIMFRPPVPAATVINMVNKVRVWEAARTPPPNFSGSTPRGSSSRRLVILFVVITAAAIVLGLEGIASVVCSIVLSKGNKPFMGPTAWSR